MTTETTSIFWLHHLTLRLPDGFQNTDRAIFVWDNELFTTLCYSLKRLVFIYETLCTLPVDIIAGDTVDVLDRQNTPQITTWQTADENINRLLAQLTARQKDIHLITPAPFVTLKGEQNVKRFFQYWKKAEKSAYLHDGGV